MYDFELGLTNSETEFKIAVIENAMMMGQIEQQDLKQLSEKEIDKLFAKIVE
jgi:hypothetical protein